MASALSVANGGTGATSFTAGSLLYGAGTGARQVVATGTVSATSPVSITAGRYVLGGAATIAIADAAADGATKGAASFAADDFDAASGNITIDRALAPTWTGLHTFNTGGIISNASSSFGWFNSASSSIGTLAVPTLTSALALTNANGVFAEYAGTTCTDQFVRVLSALGAATCATVGSADVSGLDISADTNLAVTYPMVLTDDTLSLAFGTTSNNTWSGTNNFTGSVGVSSSTPFARLSVHGGATDTYNPTLFAVASSSAAYATTTHFRILSGGEVIAPQFSFTNATGTSIYTSASSTFQVLNAGTLALASALSVANGGTGATSFTAGSLLYGAGTGALQVVATGTVSATSPVSITAGRYVLGGAATIAIADAAADGSTKGAASFAADDFDASSGNITIDRAPAPT